MLIQIADSQTLIWVLLKIDSFSIDLQQCLHINFTLTLFAIKIFILHYISLYLCFLKILSWTNDNKKHHSMKQQGEQDGRVVSTPAFGSEGPRFDPRQQPLVQLSLWLFKQSHTNSWSLFSLFTIPSFGWDV